MNIYEQGFLMEEGVGLDQLLVGSNPHALPVLRRNQQPKIKSFLLRCALDCYFFRQNHFPSCFGGCTTFRNTEKKTIFLQPNDYVRHPGNRLLKYAATTLRPKKI